MDIKRIEAIRGEELISNILDKSLFAKWLSETGDADSLDIPTKLIEEEVRKLIRLSILSARTVINKELKEIYRTKGKFSAEYGGSVIVISLNDLQEAMKWIKEKKLKETALNIKVKKKE